MSLLRIRGRAARRDGSAAPNASDRYGGAQTDTSIIVASGIYVAVGGVGGVAVASSPAGFGISANAIFGGVAVVGAAQLESASRQSITNRAGGRIDTDCTSDFLVNGGEQVC